MLEWVAWFNQQRLLESLGDVPSAAYEGQFYRARAAHAGVAALTQPSLPASSPFIHAHHRCPNCVTRQGRGDEHQVH